MELQNRTKFRINCYGYFLTITKPVGITLFIFLTDQKNFLSKYNKQFQCIKHFDLLPLPLKP